MKKAFLLVVIVVLLVMANMAQASIITSGVGVVASVGEKVDATSQTLAFFAEDGRQLSYIQGVVRVPRGQSVQCVMTGGAVNKFKDQRAYWSYGELTEKNKILADHGKETGFDWWVDPPKDPKQDRTVIGVGIETLKGKHKTARFVFEGSIGKSAWENTHVIFQYVDEQETAGNGGGSDEAMAVTNANFERIGSYVTKLEERVTNLENYASSLSASNGPRVTSTAVSANVVSFKMIFEGHRYDTLAITIIDSKGRATDYADYSVVGDCTLSLPVGEYRLFTTGTIGEKTYKSTLEMRFPVQPGMRPITVGV